MAPGLRHVGPQRSKNDKWNEALNGLLRIHWKRKESTMETESKDTMRYFNAAYVKRVYGKWIT